MRSVFADAGYLIALLHPQDDLHEAAQRVSSGLGSARLVTSEMVLTEVLNDFSKRGAHLKELAVAATRRLRQDPSTHVVRQSSELFERALELYASRADKAWSLTDCASFCIMRDLDLNDALAHDRHFVQAGFKALLRLGSE